MNQRRIKFFRTRCYFGERRIYFERKVGLSPFSFRAAAGGANLSRRGSRRSHGSGRGGRTRRRRRRRRRFCGRVSAARHQPTKLVALRIFGRESRLLAQQLHRQDVSRHHDDHRDVEGNQGAEHQERAVIDDAYSWPRHDVRGINYAWNNKPRSRHTLIIPLL